MVSDRITPNVHFIIIFFTRTAHVYMVSSSTLFKRERNHPRYHVLLYVIIFYFSLSLSLYYFPTIIYSSASSPPSAMLKYLNSYTFLSLFEAITLNQSLTLCFFKYFFVKYFKYLFDIADSEETVTEFLSELTVTWSPSAPALPCTLIRSVKNCSNDEMSMIASLTCYYYYHEIDLMK